MIGASNETKLWRKIGGEKMKCKVLYSPQYDCLMLAWPIYKNSRWYRMENDPWHYEGTAAHKMDFLKDVANFILIDEMTIEETPNPAEKGE